MDAWQKRNPSLHERWCLHWTKKSKYGGRHKAFSPVPELLDICLTKRCSNGCSYCYMGSSRRFSKMMSMQTLEAIFDGLDQAPYQVVLGGGDPLLHPGFADILQFVRERGTVPSFTTQGSAKIPWDSVNKYAGAVGLTYHTNVSPAEFRASYKLFRENLAPHVQLAVHVLADKHVVRSLEVAMQACTDIPKVILLAYMPDRGRATMDRVMPKRVYMQELPEAICDAKELGVRIGFTEGMLPYFFSRPGLLDMDQAMATEGQFSCYVDVEGNVHRSSFDTQFESYEGPLVATGTRNIHKERFQDIWEHPPWWDDRGPYGDSCYECFYQGVCASGHWTHLLNCAWQGLNEGAAGMRLDSRARERQAFWAEIEKEEA